MIHLRHCWTTEHYRSDCRALTRVREAQTEALRSELEQEFPVLFWPIKKESVDGIVLARHA